MGLLYRLLKGSGVVGIRSQGFGCKISGLKDMVKERVLGYRDVRFRACVGDLNMAGRAVIKPVL